LAEPFWQAGYQDFNLIAEAKVEEKLMYMHQNLVNAMLTHRA